jgi:hypothetical protein
MSLRRSGPHSRQLQAFVVIDGPVTIVLALIDLILPLRATSAEP